MLTSDSRRKLTAMAMLAMPTGLVWMAGMAGWMAANRVPQLLGLFAATPPPLPPER